MPAAPKPTNEAERLASLHDLDVLDSPSERGFDALVSAASLICGVPIALISLVDAERQWFKANVGLPGITETPRELAFCAHAILSDALLEIPDAALDPRVADLHPGGSERPIRFYAGVPLCLDDGHRVGTLCVIDTQPRHLDDTQREQLRNLAQAAVALLQGRRTCAQLRHAMLGLEQAEALQRRLYEQTPAMLLKIDADHRLATVSDMWLQRMGYTREEVIGRPARDFLTPQSDTLATRTGRPALFQTGHCDHVEVQFIAKSGQAIDVLYSAVTDGPPDGRPQGRLAALDDITARRRAERRLASERQYLEYMMAGAQLGLFEWNLGTGEASVNARWAEILGYAAADLNPMTFDAMLDSVHPDDLAGLQAGTERVLTGKTDVYELEYRIRHRDGHWVWVQSHGKTMARGTDCRPDWMFATIIDISERKQREAALRKSEDLLTRAGELADVGGWEVDLATNELFWSEQMYQIYGVPAWDSATRDSVLSLYTEESRDRMRDAVARCVAGEGPFDLEVPFIRPTGERIWIRTMGSATFADGKAIRLNGASQNITAQVERRLALQEVSEHLTLATKSGGVGIWSCFLADGAVRWDAGMYELHGLPPGDANVANDLWLTRMHPDDRESAEQLVGAALAARRPFETTFRIIREDGSVRHIRSAGNMIRDISGKAVRFTGTNTDITAAVAIATELEERNELLRVTLQAITDGVIAIDAANRIVWFNRAAERMTGWTAADALGRPLDEVFHNHLPCAILAQQGPAGIAANEALSAVMELQTRAAASLWVEYTVRMMHAENGTPPGAVVTFRDMTMQRALEAERSTIEAGLRQTQRLEAVGQLTAGIAHDFNNLLQGIIGANDVLRDLVGTERDAVECVDIVEQSAQRGGTLVHRLLAFARQQMLKPDVLCPAKVLAEVGPLLKHTLGGGVRVDTQLNDGVGTVLADAAQLESCLLNLALNARDAMPYGGDLRLSVRQETVGAGQAKDLAAGDYVCFAVADTGTGMSKEVMAHAFEPFFTTKPVSKGSGLGLSMVHGFAAQSGGCVRIHSAPGQGTTIEIWLPMHGMTRPAESEVERGAADGHGLGRILVVDDEAGVRRTVSFALNRAGYTVVAAEDAEAALSLLHAGYDFDLLVADQAMPGLSGTELLAEVMRLRPKMPTILMSGYDRVSGLGTLPGNVVLLEKPFRHAALLKQVRVALGGVSAGAPMSAGASANGSGPKLPHLALPRADKRV